MSRLIVVAVVLFGLTAGPAWAAGGNNLYAPYPTAGSAGASQAYYAQLGVALTNRQLKQGTFTGGLSAVPAGGPSHRAGGTRVSLGYGELAVVALLALAGATAAVLRSDRRPVGARAT